MIDWLDLVQEYAEPILEQTTSLMTVNTGSDRPTFAYITPTKRLIVVYRVSTRITVEVYNGSSMHQLSFSSYEYIALDSSMISVIEYDSQQPFGSLSGVITRPSNLRTQFNVFNAISSEYNSPGIPVYNTKSIKILLQGWYTHGDDYYTVYIEIDYYPTRTGMSFSLGQVHSHRSEKLPRYVLLPNGYAKLTYKSTGIELYQAHTGRASVSLSNQWKPEFVGINEQRLVIGLNTNRLIVFEWIDHLMVYTYATKFNIQTSVFTLDRNNLIVHDGTTITVYDTNGLRLLSITNAPQFLPSLYDRRSGVFIGNSRRGVAMAFKDGLIQTLNMGKLIGARGAPSRWFIVADDKQRFHYIETYPTNRGFR